MGNSNIKFDNSAINNEYENTCMILGFYCFYYLYI